MQKTLIYIDVDSTLQIDSSGKFVSTSSGLPIVMRGQWQILCVQFVRRDVDEYGSVSLSEVDMSGNSYLLVADNNFEDTDTLMFKSYQSSIEFDQEVADSNRFNIAGDWIDGSTADLSKGQMSIRINSNTDKFQTVLGAKEQVTSGLYINVKQYSTGLLEPSTVMWTRFVAKNTIRDWDSSAEEVPPAGINIVPIVASYMRNGMDFQFSVDGMSWHESQTTSDRYMRQRLSGVDAEWSDAIQLPAGADGYTPQKGIDYWTEADKAEIKAYIDGIIINGEW